MKDQHTLIDGYRDLSQEEIDLMNEIKAKAKDVGDLFDKLKVIPGIDQRAVSIARTEAQTSFMWAIRAVAQPTTF